MLRKVMKHIVRILCGILAFVVLTTIIVQVFYYREKENISVSELSFISDNDVVYLTAHRGVTAHAPENSLPAFSKAREMKYYAAECDVLLTKDNIWVVTHDNTMFLHFWSFKNVSETDYGDLKKFGYKNGVNFFNLDKMYLPTLDEYLDIFENSDTRVQIEIKTLNNDFIDEILKKLEDRKLVDSAIIISFTHSQLEYIREKNKNIELWYLADYINKDTIAEYKSLGDNTKLAFKSSENSDEIISDAISDGVSLAAWTVNKTEEFERLYNLGIRYITTDVFCP